jgi:amidase
MAATAIETARLVRERELTAVEVVEAHLARIDAVNGELNAVVQVDGERALAAAAAPNDGPLCGVPFTVKDNLEAAGIVMAIGAPERADVIPANDATVVARLRAAGAILIGKTNCPPYGGGIETDNPVYGRTSNPYDLSRTCGGSSGGEAAAVAAGLSTCGAGTDSGASVRLPAHFCGVAAIKPTAGRIPVTGVIDDEGPIGALSDVRTQVGPLARSVADVALLLRLLAGPDGRDAGVPPVALHDPREVRGLRVAAFGAYDYAEADADTAAVLGVGAAALREAGAVVSEAGPPRGGHDLTIEVWRSYADETGLYRLLRRWDAFRTEMLAFGERFDLLLSPVFAGPAPVHGTLSGAETVDPTSFTTPHSLTGWPAATVRCGTSSDGLPIGLQLVAKPWREDVALAAAAVLEAALGGWRPSAILPIP